VHYAYEVTTHYSSLVTVTLAKISAVSRKLVHVHSPVVGYRNPNLNCAMITKMMCSFRLTCIYILLKNRQTTVKTTGHDRENACSPWHCPKRIEKKTIFKITPLEKGKCYTQEVLFGYTQDGNLTDPKPNHNMITITFLCSLIHTLVRIR